MHARQVTTDPWPLRSSLELGALSSAVPCACLHVKHVLWEWGLNSLAESAELLVSELVTNAVNATGQPGQTVSVNLAGTGTSTGTRVLIEVRDADPQPPGPMSARWDWYPTQDPAGKVVECRVHVAGARLLITRRPDLRESPAWMASSWTGTRAFRGVTVHDPVADAPRLS